jgi:hypothetical protein
MKTSELTGAALDWAVAKCEPNTGISLTHIWRVTSDGDTDFLIPNYSSDWTQGGPIIEREKIAIDFDGDAWCASDNRKPLANYGPTPLIAAMRCYVASKMGDTVDVPPELI